jgi:cytochrome c-type biogenesis protein
MAVSILIAIGAGLISFFSPCILPLIPGFMAYLSRNDSSRMNSFINSLFFVLGFSSVFATLGILLNTLLESSSYDIRVWLSRLGGLIIIFFALHILGILKIKFLQSDHRIKTKKFDSAYLTSFLFGAAFAVGWSPCIGAVLGSIFALAVSSPGQAFLLLLSFSLGLGLPFIITGLFVTEAKRFINRSQVILKYFNVVVGILLLILGILVFLDKLYLVAVIL